jgi:hypothetical protein
MQTRLSIGYLIGYRIIIMNFKYIQHRLSKRYHRITNIIVRNIYRDTNQDVSKSIFIAGSARSGTTWLANILGSQVPSRIMFEPFYSDLVYGFRPFHNFLYMRPETNSPRLYNFAIQVFSGLIRDPWIDRETTQLFPQRRIIKDVRASLMFKWLDNKFPAVKKIFIIRHPCAVILSRMKLGWDPNNDINDFLEQNELVEDYLGSKLDLIQSCKSEEEKNALIWCITNQVPIHQFSNSELRMVFYENLVLNPDEEIPSLFQILDIPYRQSYKRNIRRPSITSTRKSAIFTNENLISKWKKELSTRQIDNIQNIVDKFGLAWIYENFSV